MLGLISNFLYFYECKYLFYFFNAMSIKRRHHKIDFIREFASLHISF
jgi:hypothetical protein